MSTDMDENFDGVDRHAINGKFPAPEQAFDLVVIGAGPAGLAAAIEGAQTGSSVLLVDENPVAAALMGTDVPLFYGGRMTGAVQSKGRMLQQIVASDPAMGEAFEAGVEVALGTYAWGAFVNGPGLAALPDSVVGLADEERAWTVGFKSLVLATGARDLALGFPGWDQPGVMGANALHALLTRYDAFAGRRIVILGSGDLALQTALLALERGLQVAALVEVEATVQGSADLLARLAAQDTKVLTSTVIARATGRLDGVERVTLARVDDLTQTTEIVCDTVCLAIGLVPAVELFNVLGGRLASSSLRGGHTPVTDGPGRTSLPQIFVAGDCAGLTDATLAIAQGRAAARAALGLSLEVTPAPAAKDNDAFAYQTAWMRALVAASAPDTVVCQCEAVTRADLLNVQPPNYLERPEKMAARGLGDLLADGPINTDQVKRLTRQGMGLCQGRRCREQSALILAMASQSPLADIPLSGYRAPVRPLPLKVLAAWDESDLMADGWDVWFGIPSQWTPYQDIGTEREAMHRAVLGGNMHL
jgi:thioredoxin reductase